MRAVLVCALIFVVAFAAATDETEMEEVSSFVETSADIAHLQAIGSEGEQEVDAEGFPVPLTKKQRRTTLEPRYLGDPIKGRKHYIVPEYAVPKPLTKKQLRKHPRVFTSHYFSPMPKPRALKCKTKKCRRAWRRAQRRQRRRNQPLKSIETYQHHRINQKGFVQPEIIANYPGGPRGDHLARKAAKQPKPFGLPKKTLAPAPIVKFLEISSSEADEAVDTSAEAEEAAAAAEADEASEFSEEELAGREQVTVLSGPEQFYAEGFQAPDWADEQMAEDESVEDEAEAEGEDESEAAEDSEEEDSDASEAENDSEVALIEENDEEESEEEADEENEDEEEADEENDEEADEENDEEADEENEDEAEEETAEVALIEANAEAQEEDEDEEEDSDAEAEAVDELAENEAVAEQIDMDASEDDADSDEEMDEEDDEEADQDEAQDSEQAETEANEQAVAEMFEVDEHLAGADTLLAEVDAHLTAHAAGESDAEADSEAESKGTPGSAISAGQTWEDAQNAKLDEMEQQLRAEKAMTPKVAAKVVSSVAELGQLDAEHQLPEYDSDEAPQAETVAPEMVDA